MLTKRNAASGNEIDEEEARLATAWDHVLELFSLNSETQTAKRTKSTKTGILSNTQR